MTELTATNRRRRFRLPSALATLAIAVAVVANVADPASAFSVSDSGTTGTTYTYAAEGRSYVNGRGIAVPAIRVTAPYVYRSPAAAGLQQVAFVPTVQVWTNQGWVNNWSGPMQVWNIPANGTGTQPGVYQFNDLARGNFYRVKIAIGWYDGYGRLLGTRTITMDGRDYFCASSFYVSCTAYTGYLALA
jgi:hypothetical protein